MEQVENVKFCVNCEYYASSYNDVDRCRCFAPKNLESQTLNLVVGGTDKKYKFPFCVEARKDHFVINTQQLVSCGKEAQWFQEKPSYLRHDLKKEKEKENKPTSLAEEL